MAEMRDLITILLGFLGVASGIWLYLRLLAF